MPDPAMGREKYTEQAVNIALAQAEVRLGMIQDRAQAAAHDRRRKRYPVEEQAEHRLTSLTAAARLIDRAAVHLAGDPNHGPCPPLEPLHRSRRVTFTWTPSPVRPEAGA